MFWSHDRLANRTLNEQNSFPRRSDITQELCIPTSRVNNLSAGKNWGTFLNRDPRPDL